MITKQPGFPLSLIKELAKNNLINNGAFIDAKTELEFVKTHPMPAGYADVDQLIEY